MVLVICGLMFGSAALLGYTSYQQTKDRIEDGVKQRVEEARIQLDDMFLNLSKQQLLILYIGLPVGLGFLGFIATGMPYVAIAGAAAGWTIPKMWISRMRKKRYAAFQALFVDSLLLLVSCLRAGLSMLQGFSVIHEEMPSPINEEFGLLLKEVRMGVSVEEALKHLQQRMPSEDLDLFVTAVLVARETGGEVTAIFGKLVETLRERKKIREKIKTLTFMARLQGIVMALLPMAFVLIIYNIDPSHFTFFLQDELGKMLLAGVAITQVIVFILFMWFSKTPL